MEQLDCKSLDRRRFAFVHEVGRHVDQLIWVFNNHHPFLLRKLDNRQNCLDENLTAPVRKIVLNWIGNARLEGQGEYLLVV